MPMDQKHIDAIHVCLGTLYYLREQYSDIPLVKQAVTLAGKTLEEGILAKTDDPAMSDIINSNLLDAVKVVAYALKYPREEVPVLIHGLANMIEEESEHDNRNKKPH